MVRTKINLWDGIAVVAVLLAALLLFLQPWVQNEKGQTLSVVTPTESFSLPLDQNCTKTVKSNGVTLIVVVENGEAWVSHSDCPDGVCVSSGKISKSGETVLCAPAGVTLTVKGGDGDVDFIAG